MNGFLIYIPQSALKCKYIFYGCWEGLKCLAVSLNPCGCSKSTPFIHLLSNVNEKVVYLYAIHVVLTYILWLITAQSLTVTQARSLIGRSTNAIWHMSYIGWVVIQLKLSELEHATHEPVGASALCVPPRLTIPSSHTNYLCTWSHYYIPSICHFYKRSNQLHWQILVCDLKISYCLNL